LDRVRANGYASASELAGEFVVDSSTIRRDLAELAHAGLVRRTRGGVLPADPAEAVDLPYDVRRNSRAAEKRALGEAAAELVQDGQSLIIDNGSTTYEVARALRSRHRLTVITNDLMVALCLSEHPTHKVHMTGGVMLDTVYTLVGPTAVASLQGLHVDWAFLGAEGVDPKAGVTNVNVVELDVKQAMIKAAEHLAVVADSSKLGRRSLAPVCPLSEVSVLLTDDQLPVAQRDAYGPALRCVAISHAPSARPSAKRA
jgi:DeoR/GlpR family transcriptional regulator of sugar metabolism